MKILTTPPTLVLTYADFRTQIFLFKYSSILGGWWGGGGGGGECSDSIAKLLILFIPFLRDEVSMDSLSYLRKGICYVNSLQKKTNMWKCYCHFLYA